MPSYKEYYLKCREKYFKENQSNSTKSVYNFTIDHNPNITIPKDTINSLYNKIKEKLKHNSCLKNSFLVGLTDNIYDLSEIEDISQIIIPYLEKNIYSCYLNLTRSYVYKNLKTQENESSSWLWHWDNHPLESIKVIIYLTDTGEDDGAFEYLSDKNGNGYKMPVNRLGPNKWGSKNHKIYKNCRITKHQLSNFSGFSPHKIVGKTGKIIIFSQNIIHKANIPKNNERVILTLQVKPILNKRDKYFCRKYTGTFLNQKDGAHGSCDPLKTDNL